MSKSQLISVSLTVTLQSLQSSHLYYIEFGTMFWQMCFDQLAFKMSTIFHKYCKTEHNQIKIELVENIIFVM